VHTDSGVGNKTAYLIMRGGTFNGIQVKAIDAGDPGRTKTATLYLDVIQKLTSGSDYADLGRQLNQSCSDLVGTKGFTSDDCTQVAKAVQATELAKQPAVAGARTPTDAPQGCPSGQVENVLLDNEAATTPADQFTIGKLWTRAPGTVATADGGYPVGSNATSGKASWFGLDPDPSFGDPKTSNLTLKNAVHVPAGGKTYMRFNHWYAFDYEPGSKPIYYDGGLVLVDNAGDAAVAQQTSGLPWVNGPTRRIVSGGTAPTGFAGVSNGYTSSRVDLSSYAGKNIKPQFQLRGDSQYSIEGWYLDDIEIFTCGADLPNKPTGVTSTGDERSATVEWTPPAYAGNGISGYRVTGPGGTTRDLPSGARSTTFTGLKPGTSYTFTVRALNQQSHGGAGTSTTVSGTRFTGPTVARTGTSKTKVTGRLLKGSAGVLGKLVQVQRKKSNGTWSTVATPKTNSAGRLSATLSGRSKASYRLVFPGGTSLLGRTSSAKHL
jgi:bacillolysin